MKVLLDTHVWVWFLTESQKLSSTHREIIEDETNEIWLSAISIWEVSMLIEKKRLSVGIPAKKWINQALVQVPIKEAPITFQIAKVSRTINLMNEDPADRFIAATAKTQNLALMTYDSSLLNCTELEFA
jgi:PIN domain nuclease of toxin-antitoxin system